MSRVYVKNLPMHVTEKEIKDHFRDAGTITDVTLQYAADGHFRRIAFLGFFEPDQAKIIKKYNGTVIKGSKLSIYPALSHNDAIQQNRKRSAREENHVKVVEAEKEKKQGASEFIKKIHEEGGSRLADYLKSSQQQSWNDQVLDDAPRQEKADAPQEEKEAAETQKEFDPIKLKLKNLPKTASEEQLSQLFSTYGKVHQAIVAINPITKEPSGVGFIVFEVPQGVRKIMKRHSQVEVMFQGKYITAQRATVQEIEEQPAFKEYLKKAFDKHNRNSWNALTQRQENVTKELAARLNVAPEEIQHNAVALAAGEALLNQELLDTMKNIGLRLAGERSKTAILVKNLPQDVAEADLRQQFAQFGSLITCSLFYTGFCLVQFTQPSDARRAFSKLAFKKLGAAHVPMMLEWAILADKVEEAAEKPQPPQEAQEEAPAQKAKQAEVTTKSIHIRSISFATDAEKFDATLRQALGASLIACNLVSGLNGHKGFGFATVPETALQDSIQRISKIIVDGFKWEAQESRQQTASTGKVDDQDLLDTTKLIIKNLAFQASAKELKQLAAQFGRIVSFRAPKKLDGALRGFAFVEYATEREATEACKLLKTTHFYGRHLVVEPSYDKEAQPGVDLQ